MNLKLHLFSRIFLIALLSVVVSAFYVLHQTDKQARYEATLAANLIHQQVNSQLLQMFSRYDLTSNFPNTELWPDINGISGSCIQFLSRSEARRRNVCNDTAHELRTWPTWFGHLYQNLFHPDFEVKKTVAFNAMTYGSIVVTLNSRIETARAWNTLRSIIGVLFFSIFAVSILVSLTINRLLMPAQTIIHGLEKMRDGQLDTRLPPFDINEWKRTSEAINQLAQAQQTSLDDNKQLALKLMNMQEEQQRYISRELHDEFGQCLAGINALASSINQTAKNQAPDLVHEVNNISNISQHMMSVLRDMLTRLRPTEVDDLGLATSLQNLVNSWNNRSKGQTNYQLFIIGDVSQLAEPLPTNLYRVVQECLTNTAKHAQASQASVSLVIEDKQLALTISDDGIADLASFDNTIGVGLLGIRERITALGGNFSLQTQQPKGLTILITVPLLV